MRENHTHTHVHTRTRARTHTSCCSVEAGECSRKKERGCQSCCFCWVVVVVHFWGLRENREERKKKVLISKKRKSTDCENKKKANFRKKAKKTPNFGCCWNQQTRVCECVGEVYSVCLCAPRTYVCVSGSNNIIINNNNISSSSSTICPRSCRTGGGGVDVVSRR